MTTMFREKFEAFMTYLRSNEVAPPWPFTSSVRGTISSQAASPGDGDPTSKAPSPPLAHPVSRLLPSLLRLCSIS